MVRKCSFKFAAKLHFGGYSAKFIPAVFKIKGRVADLDPGFRKSVQFRPDPVICDDYTNRCPDP